MKSNALKKIAGQPSFQLQTRTTNLAVTEMGGHMAPVRFFRDSDSPFEPYFVAPWATERVAADTPKLLVALRGDFFCLPFGGNGKAWRGEKHPPHGETANAVWTLEDRREIREGAALVLSMRTALRVGAVRKRLALVEGENTVYCRHEILDMKGPMPLGHHATLRFPDQPGSGLVSVSPFRHGQAYPGLVENPENKGYSILKPGAEFRDLRNVKRIDGETADLSRYPARRGFEDIAMVCSDPAVFPAWSAVVFPGVRVLWFALKDPGVLASTVLWHDNGGRHYPPWNGRSVNTLGIEDVTAHFHDGLAESATKNALNAKGIPTSIRLSPTRPFAVNYIQGTARIPRGFGRVREIVPVNDTTLRFRDETGKTFDHRVRWSFLKSGKTGVAGLD